MISAVRAGAAEVFHDFSPNRIGATTAYGVIFGVTNITSVVAMMALVFRGDLSYALPLGIGIGLFSSMINGVINAIGSSFNGTVVAVQDTTAIAGVAAAAIAIEVTGERQIPTVIALLMASTTLTSIVFLLTGYFRLGGLVRYLPNPVIGGFQVATGVLFLLGALGILVPDGFSEAWELDSIVSWLPAASLGVVLHALTRTERSRPVIPWLIVSACAIVHVAFWINGTSFEEARQRGWLFGGLDGTSAWELDTLLIVGDADWRAVLAQTGAIITIAVLAPLGLLIRMHSLDAASGSDIDVNRELRVTGLSNIAALPAAGPPAYIYFATSLLLRRLGGPRRGAALLSVLLVGAAILAGSTILTIVPAPVVGAVLISQALGFLVVWLWDARSRLDRIEYLLVAGSGIAVLLFGFLNAIALGTIAAIALFVFRYSRIDAIRHSYTLRVFRSATERSTAEADILERHGDRGVVLELHGYLFFGTAHDVFTDPRIIDQIDSLDVVVIHLTQVTGLDSSASASLSKLARLADQHDLAIALAGSAERIEELVAQADPVGMRSIHRFDSLDAAVHWCEERILDTYDTSLPKTAPTIQSLLAEVAGSGEQSTTIVSAFTHRSYQAGSVVIEQGEPAPGFFFLESGSLIAQLPSPNGSSPRRLRT
ncbi:MAG: STAS domain-containing protein, partial [Acidimicrobiia bacterium]|nr:STAS domain-containing protein [Acidimicrobiia bacterium]